MAGCGQRHGHLQLTSALNSSPAEIAFGYGDAHLTSTQNGDCLPVTDQMTITILPAPVADAGCAGRGLLQQRGGAAGRFGDGAGGGQWSGGAGTFAPSIASLNAVYTPRRRRRRGHADPHAHDHRQWRRQAVTDDVLITFTAIPTAEAGRVVCSVPTTPASPSTAL